MIFQVRSAPVLSALWFRGLLTKLCRAPGRVPKELADLTNLTTLYLYGNKDLQRPDGAPTDSDGVMFYESREEVAAFQACLK